MSRKKIAMIGLKGLPATGGAAAVGENIVRELSDKYDFTVYATGTHATEHDFNGTTQIIFRKFPIRSVNIFYYYIASALHAVFKGKYDLVHLHHIDGAFILFLLRLKYKVVSTSHGLSYRHAKWSRFYRPYFKFNEWLQCRLSNHITLVSRSLMQHYALKCPLKKLSFIPNGIRLTENIPIKEYGDYLLFAAGRIIPSKGLTTLVNAFRKMNTDMKLLVIGDLDQVASYKKELLASSVNLNIEFIDLIRSEKILKGYLSRSALFIFPSLYEAMSMMLMEAVSSMAPVICSDIEANSDVFTNAEVLFFKAGDSDDLCDKIKWALSHRREMGEFALNAYKKLELNYRWDVIAEKYDQVYGKLMN